MKMHGLKLFVVFAISTTAFPFPSWWRLPKQRILGYVNSNSIIQSHKDQGELLQYANVDFTTGEGLDSWLSQQRERSFYLMLENIGGILTLLSKEEVWDGAVVASRLREHPNYFFIWTRDSALTIRSLIDELPYADHHAAKRIRTVIEQYIKLSSEIQKRPNRSGDFGGERRSGLGEPKFMPNGQPFNEPWGRPQSDGPALRVLTIYSYVAYLKDANITINDPALGNFSRVYSEIIRPDLEYVMSNWKEELFDLWEEIKSMHFFNAMVQLKCLSDGLELAEAFESSSSFIHSLKEHREEIKTFILNPETGFSSKLAPHIVETPSLFYQRKRSGLDAATLLASLHTHDFIAGDQNIPFDVDDSHVLNTITSMVSDMQFRYPVNHKYVEKTTLSGVGLGRYPEDVYDGYQVTEGNPWFICTASASETLYRLVLKSVLQGKDITILPETVTFYSLFIDDLLDEEGRLVESTSRIEYGSHRYTQTLRNIFAYADTFMEVIRDHVDEYGRMLEQFNKNTGYMQGATDLTWSYSSFCNSVRWRTKAHQMLETFD